MATTSAEGLKRAIRQTLINNDAINSIVGNRVVGNHEVKSDDRTVEFPRIVIELYLGDVSPQSSYQFYILEIWCYHRVSSSHALSLYDRVFEALHHQKMNFDEISTKGYCLEMNRPTEGYAEMVRSYWARGRWTARASEA